MGSPAFKVSGSVFATLCVRVCSGMALVMLFLCFEILFMFGTYSTMQVKKKKKTHNIIMYTNVEYSLEFNSIKALL